MLPPVPFTDLYQRWLFSFFWFGVWGFCSQTSWLVLLKVIWVSHPRGLISPSCLHSLPAPADTALMDRVFDHAHSLCPCPGTAHFLNIPIIHFSHPGIFSVISDLCYLFRKGSTHYLMMSGDRQAKGLECHSGRYLILTESGQVNEIISSAPESMDPTEPQSFTVEEIHLDS